ncbi:MAG: hypothetical protein HRT98_04335 [Mycoplasmatales bacterium]|nr:hypothetical protein [Mycoplasmatales bacterium]
MKIKLKKIGMLSMAIGTPVATIAATAAMANNPNHEYISMKINGKRMIFKNISEATNYIMRKQINVQEKITIGEIKYLNKNHGLINPDSQYNYEANSKHLAPAYKKMNGEYTRSKKEAIKSYIGRSHLVPQYYDGREFHEGNSIGLKEAKDAILSRQKSAMVPFYKVPLNDNGAFMNINPFNKVDIKALQTKAISIYNQNKNNSNSNSKHITSTYLLPTKDGGQISVLPSNPLKGLQINDLIREDFGIQGIFKKWLHKQVKFRLSVDAKNTPYVFKWNEKYPVSKEVDLQKIGSDGMVVETDYNYFLKNTHYFAAFFSNVDFWNHFDERLYSQLGKDYANKAIPSMYKDNDSKKQNRNMFGGSMSIENNNHWRHGSSPGVEDTINRNGVENQYTTHAKLEMVLKDPNNFTFEKFKEEALGKKQNSLFSRLAQSIQDTFLEQNQMSEMDGYDKIKKIIDSLNKNKPITSIKSSDKEMNGDKNPFELRYFNNYIKDKVFNNTQTAVDTLKSLRGIENNKIDNPNLDLNESNLSFETFKTLLKNKGIKLQKLLLVNKTPIATIDEAEKSKIIDWDIYKHLSFFKINENNATYYGHNLKLLSGDKLINEYKQSNEDNQDFMKKMETSFETMDNNNYITLSPRDFGDIRKNPIYNTKSNDNIITPFMMLNSDDNTSIYNHDTKPMFLAKILTNKGGKIESINKISNELLFHNNRQLKDRKEEINNGFFEPAIVYIIYNDNDEVIDEFKSSNFDSRFDDLKTIKHNAESILSDYIRKDVAKVFVKKKDNTWTNLPIENKINKVYNLKWENKTYMFENFQNVKDFIEEWVKTNSETIIVKG